MSLPTTTITIGIRSATVVLGWLASSFANDIWQLFIFYSVIATLGQVGISSFSATATLAPWFPRSKGAVLGTADAGNPAGQAIVVPLAQLIVSTLGWQWAYRIFGVAFFFMVALPNLLLQKRPTDGEQNIRAAEAAVPEEAGITDVPADTSATGEASSRSLIGEAIREPAVWFLCAARAVGSVGSQMTIVHMLAYLFLAGYGEMQAALGHRHRGSAGHRRPSGHRPDV